MSEENKAVIRRFVEEVQTHHNLDAVDELFSPDCKDHSGSMPPGIPNNPAGFKQFFGILISAFPDLKASIHDMVAEGDKVVTRKSFSGTHRGDFMGIPATGNQIQLNVIDIMRVVEGKITDHWAVADQLGLMQQLGVLPPPGQ